MYKIITNSIILSSIIIFTACGGDEDDGGSTTSTTQPSATSTTQPSANTVTHNSVTYGTVTSPFTNKVWLDRHLGASQACTALDDTACYGDYYQWGRDADGHEKSDSTRTDIIVTTLTPGHGEFIDGADWTTADDNGSLRSTEWSKTDGTSICPVGYRVPTITEIYAETLSASTAVISNTDAFNNFLKLPSSGNSNHLDYQGSVGYLWGSDDIAGPNASGIYFSDGNTGWGAYTRAVGFPVRCIKD